ncbi:hypothetical protein CQZ94_26100 [Bacillus sp. MYb209]|nr:hypothetical protein CQZ94_26100 [Bacillus sp. MYb209]
MNRKGNYKKWDIDNCAEVWSARDAILKGARYDNFIVRTETLRGGFAEPCKRRKSKADIG